MKASLVVFAMVVCLAVVSVGTAAESSSRDSANKSVTNFSLLDYRGKSYELRRAEGKVVVLFFTGLNCPIARQCVPKLEALDREFRERGVTVWQIDAMPHDGVSDREVATIADLAGKGVLTGLMPKTGHNAKDELDRVKSLTALSETLPRSLAVGDLDEFKQQVRQSKSGMLPLLCDEGLHVSQAFGVKRTCEAIAIDVKKMEIVYRGAIDDQMTPGARKPAPTQLYLTDALKEHLAGKSVTTASTAPQGCLLQFDDDGKEVSYSKQVAPLIVAKCAGCHTDGAIGPFAFDKYDAAKRWSAMMREVLLDRRMPPWDADPHYGRFDNDHSLTVAEKRALLKWIEQGSPRGEGDDPLAAPRPAPKKWELGEPDFVVPLPKRQDIPATGTLEYRYLTSTFEMPEDTWLRAAVCRPDNPKVTHHIIVRLKLPKNGKSDGDAYVFSIWAPGTPQTEFPPDTGMFVPKGTRFQFEVHYTPDGVARTDLSELGLYVAKEQPRLRLDTRVCETRDLQIPPGEADARHACQYCFRKDALLYDCGPHMHLRGSWFKFTLLYPDGQRETLLSVPRYDFNWQHGHRLKEPRRIPAGTWLLCTGGFDNSTRNPHNPDPKQRVKWGLQTSDEMFMGFFAVADLNGDEPLSKK